jgi:hypothetical protein
MKYLYTKNDHYRLFVNKHKTDRIKKNIKIYTTSKDKLLIESGIINEIFNNPLQTEYRLYKNAKNLKAIFKSNSNTEYRLDVFPIVEENKGIVNHISFSTSNNNITDKNEYEALTDKKEMIEILNRIHFILNKMVENSIVYNYFCIGASEIEKRNNIYEYFLEIVVGVDGFDKLKTDVYKNKEDDLNWGLYFKI